MKRMRVKTLSLFAKNEGNCTESETEEERRTQHAEVVQRRTAKSSVHRCNVKWNEMLQKTKIKNDQELMYVSARAMWNCTHARYMLTIQIFMVVILPPHLLTNKPVHVQLTNSLSLSLRSTSKFSHTPLQHPASVTCVSSQFTSLRFSSHRLLPLLLSVFLLLLFFSLFVHHLHTYHYIFLVVIVAGDVILTIGIKTAYTTRYSTFKSIVIIWDEVEAKKKTKHIANGKPPILMSEQTVETHRST